MRLTLTARRLPLPNGFAEMVNHRLTHALGRLAAQVRAVDLRLADVNGPKGGVDVECLARVRLDRGGELVVRGQDVDPAHAVAQVLERVRQNLRRAHERVVDAWRRND